APSPPATTRSTPSGAPTACNTAARYWVAIAPPRSLAGRAVQRRRPAQRRGILPDLKRAVDACGAADPAPARDKPAGQRRIVKIDGDRVVDDAPDPGRRDRPAAGAAIVIEPGLEVVEPAAEPQRRHSDAEPHRKAALGLADHQLRAGGHA